MQKFKFCFVVVLAIFFTPLNLLASNVLTVDGIGSIPTSDPLFPTSFKTISNAFSEISVRYNLTSKLTINVTADIIDDPGILIDVPVDVDIIGKMPNKTNLRLSTNGIPNGKSGNSTGIAIIQKSNQSITFKNFIVTPQPGMPGVINTAVMYISNQAADTGNSVTTIENCIFTSISGSNQLEPDLPVINPFIHNVSTETSVGRRSELRSFDGGGQINIIEIDQSSDPLPNSLVTVNFVDSVFTHILATPGAVKGGAISIRRKTNWTMNVEGCIFSYLEGSGIRCSTSVLETSNCRLNIIGTDTKPNIFLKNGWMENSNDGMASGVIYQSANAQFSHCYFINNFSSGIVKNNGTGDLLISQCVFAENQFDLNPASGSQPSVADGSHLKLYFNQSLESDITIENSTFYDCKGASGHSLFVSSQDRRLDCLFENVIFSGASDKLDFNKLKIGSTYSESNCAFVQSGSDSMINPGFLSFPTGISPVSQYRSLSEPMFHSKLFVPIRNPQTNIISNVSDYLKSSNPLYNSNREPGASLITGHHIITSNAGVDDYQFY